MYEYTPPPDCCCAVSQQQYHMDYRMCNMQDNTPPPTDSQQQGERPMRLQHDNTRLKIEVSTSSFQVVCAPAPVCCVPPRPVWRESAWKIRSPHCPEGVLPCVLFVTYVRYPTYTNPPLTLWARTHDPKKKEYEYTINCHRPYT